MFRRLQLEIRSVLDEDDDGVAWRWPWLRRFLRFWVLVAEGFIRNRCPVRASALAYSSLLAFIPLLALVVGVSTGVLKNSESQIRGWMDDILIRVAPQLQKSDEVDLTLDQAVTWIFQRIQSVNSGTLGTTGFIALLAVILFMLARIEETLNDIWGVTRGRTWYSRVVNYWAALTLGPIFLVTAVGFSTTLQLNRTQAWLLDRSVFLTLAVENVAPILVLGVVCAAFYILMPNTRVQWRAALVGGGVAGVLWHLNNTWSVEFTSQLTRNSAIYAGLAIVPVFMVGLYFFWLLLLLGAQVTCTYQNRHTFVAARELSRIHQHGREWVALRVMLEVARAYQRGLKPPTGSGLAQALGVPGALVAEVKRTLLQAGLVVEVGNGTGDWPVLPARPVEMMRVTDVLDAMRRGSGTRPLGGSDDLLGKVVEGEMEQVILAEQHAGSRTLAELVASRVETRISPAAPRVGG
mgnify:CR=1 FL=1